jgi:hypothetical protein
MKTCLDLELSLATSLMKTMFVRERHFTFPEYLTLSNAQLSDISNTFAKQCNCTNVPQFYTLFISHSLTGCYIVLRVRLNIIIYNSNGGSF